MQALEELDVWYCEQCGKHVPDYEPDYCCDGYECGCGGIPSLPCFCSDECYEQHERDEDIKLFVSREVRALKRIRLNRIRKEFESEQARILASDSLPKSFTQWPLLVGSAFSVVNAVKYRMQEDGAGGVWLFGDCPNAADHTYHGYTDRQQNGFGGSHISFNLVDGGSITLKGPFKTSPPKELGMKILSRGVVARSKSRHPDLADSFGFLTTYHDVLHLDRDWTLGDFGRIKGIAQSIANERGEKVFYRSETLGGATSAWADPKQ